MDKNYAEKPYPPPNPEDVGYGQPYQHPPGYMPVPQGPPGPPGMPQQAGYPPQQAGYPPQQAGYPPPQPGYAPPPMPQQPGYPPPPGMPQGPPPMPQQVHYSQQYPNTVVVQQPMIVQGPPLEGEAPNQLGCAIFVCLCCFCPTGIVAIVKAREARQLWFSGDATNSLSSADSARKWIIASVVLGIVVTIGSILFKLLARKMLEDDTDDYYDY